MIDYNSAKENRDRDGLYRYWFDKLKIKSYNTGRPSIITDDEYEKYVKIFVDYDMAWKRFPADHPNFPNMPMARLIGDYFDYSAKVHGFETYSEFVRWKYNDGPWKPSGQIFYFDYKLNQNKDE
jgi:hypothetical protein